MKIAIYDLDNTITSRPTFTHFLLFYAWQASPIRLVGLPLWILALIGYHIGLYDRKTLKQFGVQMFIGRNIGSDTSTKIIAEFADMVITKGLQPGAVAQVRLDRDSGAFLVLATAAPEFYAQTIGDLLGFQAVIATRHIMTPDGQLTNRILGDNCYADEKLRRIEALHSRPGSEGERQAAQRARDRIQARLKQLEAEEPPIEVRFTLADQWSRHLFVALLRRYGIPAYRYRGQRRTTVMARLSRAFVNETLWPEFLELQGSLAAYFDALTDRVIEQALEVKAGEAEERPQSAPQLPPQDHQGSLL